MDICLIPARGGSKRIPRKNIKLFCGRPMIEWSIAAARNSGCFDRIIVSTDDLEIAQIASGAGAEVPFMRPDHLSDDHSTTVDVVVHALNEISNVDNLCCLYATAPFVMASDIADGASLMQHGCDYVIPITTYAYPIERSLRIDQNSQLQMNDPELYRTRTQDLEEAWHDAGMFYWGSAQQWITGKNPYEAKVTPLVIPRKRVQDIDTLEDWERAELMFRALFIDVLS
jgi:pseudaminic acid cytidylyltransferase